MGGGLRLLPLFENAQGCGIVIEQNEGADDRVAGQEITALVFLKGARASADEVAGPLLGEVKFLADTANLLGVCQTFSAGLKPVERAVGQFHVGPGVDALVATVAVPAWHIE